ncbi:hypothetical protein EDEG_02305 [Edhazardia aedis USNM 41457]|uniref:Uncharacterized protein n=1 Tax=Edhazardia aedis (strain USNM 41457) TaxID=1003232 RepID=J8ZUJ4_EDHAE|nr:hypothetical protein EDEG_02305 [Edhazardia aedis USNM 41457]|eukprot:EJW03348.1 hypothetical protein EDEG_02305 [Edhazardia aedis USNM 41457]
MKKYEYFKKIKYILISLFILYMLFFKYVYTFIRKKILTIKINTKTENNEILASIKNKTSGISKKQAIAKTIEFKNSPSDESFYISSDEFSDISAYEASNEDDTKNDEEAVKRRKIYHKHKRSNTCEMYSSDEKYRNDEVGEFGFGILLKRRNLKKYQEKSRTKK